MGFRMELGSNRRGRVVPQVERKGNVGVGEADRCFHLWYANAIYHHIPPIPSVILNVQEWILGSERQRGNGNEFLWNVQRLKDRRVEKQGWHIDGWGLESPMGYGGGSRRHG